MNKQSFWGLQHFECSHPTDNSQYQGICLFWWLRQFSISPNSCSSKVWHYWLISTAVTLDRSNRETLCHLVTQFHNSKHSTPKLYTDLLSWEYFNMSSKQTSCNTKVLRVTGFYSWVISTDNFCCICTSHLVIQCSPYCKQIPKNKVWMGISRILLHMIKQTVLVCCAKVKLALVLVTLHISVIFSDWVLNEVGIKSLVCTCQPDHLANSWEF